MATQAEQMMMATQQAIQQMADQMTKLTTQMAEQGNKREKFGQDWDKGEKYKNIKMFSGDQKDWEEYSTKLRSQIGAGSRKTAQTLDWVETQMSEAEMQQTDWAELIKDDEMTAEGVKEMGAKLHNLLLALTTGEANATVRRCREANGMLAWKRLCTTLNPRTLASGVKAISQVLTPHKIPNAMKADTYIEAWEDKLVRLDVEYGEKVSSKMKVAVLYSMLPKDLQEKILDSCAVSWDSADEKQAETIYTKARDDVKNIAKSRRDMVTPKPMEVDQVQAQAEYWDAWQWAGGLGEEPQESIGEEGAGGENHDENNINYVGNDAKGKGKGKCWTCGEFGHRSFECPKGGGKNGKGWINNGGDGKGGKGGGWSNNKGGNGFNGGKGAGNGLGKGGWQQRACFNCGSTGHLARECPSRAGQAQQVREVVREELDEPEILFIGHLEATVEEAPEMNWQSVRAKRGNRTHEFCCGHDAPPGLEARGFRVLQADESDDDEMLEEVGVIGEIAHGGHKKGRVFRGNARQIGEPQFGEPVQHYVMKVEAETQAGKQGQKKKKSWASLGVGEIVVDSAADESCWPVGQGDAFETLPVRKNIILKTANGGEMKHYGEKKIMFAGSEGGEVTGVTFQVTDVRKPLLAVRRLVERGSTVHFGMEPQDNYIYNTHTAVKIPMERRGGSFVIKAHFMKELSEAEPVFTGRVR